MVGARKTKTVASGRKQYTAPALEKGLDILEILAGEPVGLNITELAKRQGRSVGEVFRMVAVLEQRGYIRSPEDSEAYVITLRMFELSHRFPPIVRISAAAAAPMRNLSNEINQSCHLVIYYEGRGHVVAQHDAPTERILTVRLGAEAPLVDTCSGHIFLAFSTREVRESMIEKIPPHQRKLTIKELGPLVKRIKRQGNEIMKSAQVQGVRDIGYPVLDQSGEVVAALVVPFVNYLDDSHLIPLKEAPSFVKEAASVISAALGHVAT